MFLNILNNVFNSMFFFFPETISEWKLFKIKSYNIFSNASLKSHNLNH